MKNKQKYKTKIENILSNIEKKLEYIKQRDYVFYDGRNWLSFSEIDYPSLKAMFKHLKKNSQSLYKESDNEN